MRTFMNKHGLIPLALVALALMSGCDEKVSSGGSAAPSDTPPSPPPTSEAPSPPPSAAPSAAPAPKVEVTIASVANTMAFDKTKLSVPSGSEVHLTLKNNATMSTLPHNWVLVTSGTQAKVAADGLTKGPDAGYIAEGPSVLAYTPLAPPGGTVDVTFKAPAAGDYPYICTVPGHYMMMKGVLTVTP
jgi:azurin